MAYRTDRIIVESWEDEVQFKDESFSTQSPFEVRFSDEADLEVWERGRHDDDWETAPSVLEKRELRRHDRDPL